MSRIERGRVQPGETTGATALDDTYDDYTQTAALDGDNTREQAFDLPHFTNVSIVKDTGTALLGNVGLSHTGTTTSVASSTSTPVLHPVQNVPVPDERVPAKLRAVQLVAGEVQGSGVERHAQPRGVVLDHRALVVGGVDVRAVVRKSAAWDLPVGAGGSGHLEHARGGPHDLKSGSP